MARIISVGTDNPVKFLWRKFNSLDFFTKLALISMILLTIVTWSILDNYQIFNIHGESEAQRLQAITQLEQSQRSLQNAITKPAPATGGFNLIDSLQKFFVRIEQMISR